MNFESFFLLFKSNAAAARKDIKEVEKTADEFQDKLNKTDKNLEKVLANLVELGVTAVSSFAAFDTLKHGIANAASMNAELYRQNILTGESADKLAAWDAAFENSTGKKGEFIAWFNQYSRMLQSMGRDSSQVLPNLRALADELQKLPEDQARLRFQQISQVTGLPPDFFITLRQGGAAMDELIAKFERLNQVDKKSTETATEFSKAWQTTLADVGGFFTQLGNIVLPILTKILNFFNTPIAIPKWLEKILDSNAVTRLLLAPMPEKAPEAPAAAARSGSGPLGMRNNNPGNLRSWGGAPTVGGFAQFPSLAEGLRAEQKQLELYGSRGINTLASIASRWAPPGENNTQAYIKHLMQETGFGANQRLDLSDPAIRARVANAINSMENGSAYGNLISASAGRGGSSPSLSVGQITVNTQATDAHGVAAALSDRLKEEYRLTMSNYDDGVSK